jgi:succinate dehydrogenase / fumarate reductase cytochrome b subunit
MWLINSSIGRKFIMALTGICLVLFVTFHVLMNAVAICWPTAYNQVCHFLGANWYALIASCGLGLLFVLHIIDALVLTIQNRKARGNDRYQVNARPKTVEWSSQNMLVLGIVVIVFLAIHLMQFWYKMQAQEAFGQWYETADGLQIPAAAGTLFIQFAFEQWWTPVVYLIGFAALWFHMNHGFWSMWQSIGWNNATWLPRLKSISAWWTSIVIALFAIQAITFTIRANEKYYLTNGALVSQYQELISERMTELQKEKQAEIANIMQEAQAVEAKYSMQTPEGIEAMTALQQRYEAIEGELQEIQGQMWDNYQGIMNLGLDIKKVAPKAAPQGGAPEYSDEAPEAPAPAPAPGDSDIEPEAAPEAPVAE